MHICYLTHEYPLPGIKHGGVGSFVRTLAKKLVEYNHRVSVIGAGYTDEEYVCDAGIHIYPIQHSKWLYAGFIENSMRINDMLRKIHKINPIDIVEAPEAGLAFIEKDPSIKYMIRMHGGHHFFTIAERRRKEKWKVLQERRSFKKADAMIGVSEYVVSTTRELLPFSQPATVIYNPVDVQSFSEADETKINSNELLFAGTICEKKGIRQLVQAMTIVKEKHPDVILKIVGRDWYYPKTGKCYTDYLKTLIDPGVKEHIRFIGHVSHDQMPYYIQQAQVCVFPSHMEAMPIAWIEALAMGKAVVASTSGPGTETIVHGKTGLLANPYEPEDIAEKISYMLTNREAAKAMGKAARLDVIERFDINNCVLDNIRFYEEQIANHSTTIYEISGDHARYS